MTCTTSTSLPAPTPALAGGGTASTAGHWHVFEAGTQPVSLLHLTCTDLKSHRANSAGPKQRAVGVVCGLVTQPDADSSSQAAPCGAMLGSEGLFLLPQPAAGSWLRRHQFWLPRAAVGQHCGGGGGGARSAALEGRGSAGGIVFMHQQIETDLQTVLQPLCCDSGCMPAALAAASPTNCAGCATVPALAAAAAGVGTVVRGAHWHVLWAGRAPASALLMTSIRLASGRAWFAAFSTWQLDAVCGCELPAPPLHPEAGSVPAVTDTY